MSVSSLLQHSTLQLQQWHIEDLILNGDLDKSFLCRLLPHWQIQRGILGCIWPVIGDVRKDETEWDLGHSSGFKPWATPLVIQSDSNSA